MSAEGPTPDAEKDARIAELEATVQALQDSIEASSEDSEKDAKINELQAEIDALHAQGGQPVEGVAGTATAAAPVLAEKNPSPGLDVGQAEVQERADEMTRTGTLGTPPDPTPNEHYSLETGPEAPTPETDPELAAQAKAAVDGNALLDTGTRGVTQAEEEQRTGSEQ